MSAYDLDFSKLFQCLIVLYASGLVIKLKMKPIITCPAGQLRLPIRENCFLYC